MESFTIAIVEWIIKLFRVYLVAGLIFAVPFVIFGVQRVDPNVHGWAIGFRIMIIPGVTAFWPMFATRLLRGKTLPSERNAHRISAKRLT